MNVQTIGYSFYKTLDMKEISKIGHWLLMSLTGKDYFLTRAIIWACLTWEENTAKFGDTIFILVTGTIRVWRQDFSRNVRIGSSLQDLLGDDKISLETSASEAGLNTMPGWCTTGKPILQLEAKTGKEVWIWLIFGFSQLSSM